MGKMHTCSDALRPVGAVMGAARFLIGEDDSLLARAIARLMRPHESVVAGTVREALVALSAPGWTGLLVDIGLPDGSGLDVLVRARASGVESPAVILTGYLDAELLNTAYDLRAEYLVKPVSADRITRFVMRSTSATPRVAAAVRVWVSRHDLSDAEGDILGRAASGDSREAIAAGRRSSQATIQKQVSCLLRRTGHDSLHAAVEQLLRELVVASG